MSEKPQIEKDSCSTCRPPIPWANGDDPTELALSRPRIFLIFFLVAGVLYFQTLGCPFLWDEYRLILGNAQAGAFRWENLGNLFSHRYFYVPGSFKNDFPVDLPYYRPITVLFHGLSYNAFRPFFPAYHLESVFLHTANTLLLFGLFSILFRRPSASTQDEAVCLAAAILFLVHPRNVETVSVIANQTGLLCTFFCLLSLCSWAKLLKGGNRPVLLYCLSLLALLLSMLSKETAYGVPLLHALVFLLVGPRNKRSFLLLCGYFLLPGVPLMVRREFLGGQSIVAALFVQMSRLGSWTGYAGSILGLLLHQFYVWLLPFDTQLFQYPFSVTDLSAQQLILPALAAILLAWRLRKQTGLLAFGLGWFFVFYLPSSNMISIGTLPGGSLKAGAHHLYPAHAGLCLLLAASILLPPSRNRSQARNRRFSRLQRFALGLIVFLLALQAFRFAGHFRSADRFYQAIFDRNPLHAGAWTNYGWHKLYIDKDPESSEWVLLNGLQIANKTKNLAAKMDFTNNLMVLFLEHDRLTEAETMLQSVMDEWIVHPRGNIYFWHIVQLRERVMQIRRERATEAS